MNTRNLSIVVAVAALFVGQSGRQAPRPLWDRPTSC